MSRNLLYHLTPMGDWKKSIADLSRYIAVFDGKKLIAVALGKGLGSFVDVQSALEDSIGNDFILIPFENDPALRETSTFLSLLRMMEPRAVSGNRPGSADRVGSTDRLGSSDDVTFYGHSKGVTRGGDEAVRLWTNLLYETNLSDWPAVEKLLDDYPVVGALKRHGRMQHFPRDSMWHYSGTFFWFRNQDLFAKDWNKIQFSRYGAESYLSLLFKSKEAGCIFGDEVQNLYSLPYVKSLKQKWDKQKRK